MSHSVQDPHCVFCKIVRGEIPSARVLETALAVVQDSEHELKRDDIPINESGLHRPDYETLRDLGLS